MKAWEIVSDVLKLLKEKADVGVNLLELDKLAEQRVAELGGISINKGYQPPWAKTPFPATICTNVNDGVAHGIPYDYELQDGDLVSFDLGVKKDGLCGDAALTTWVGKLADRDERLLRYAKRITQTGIAQVQAGATVNDVSSKMYWYAKKMGFVVNKIWGGHTIGVEMHENPMIPVMDFYFEPDVPLGQERLKENQMICIEPLVTYRDIDGRTESDGWTVKTRDERKSAIFECQVRVMDGGCEILTPYVLE